MSDTICPNCRRPNRAGAHFCNSCGATLAGATPAAAPASGVAQQAKEMAGQVAQAATPVAKRAAQAAAPVAQQAAQRSWQVSKQGMGWFARLITGGGRSAYTEIVSPQPITVGQVVSPPQEDWVPTPLEGAAIIFFLSLLLGWLVFLLPLWWHQLLVILGLLLLLLILNFAGLRRPVFSRLFWTKALRRAKQVPRLTCQVQDQLTNQVIRLTIIGQRTPGQLYQGANVQAYGVRYAGQNEVRAWKVDLGSGQEITAPRLAPLVAIMLLAPMLLGLVWLLRWGIPFLMYLWSQIGGGT